MGWNAAIVQLLGSAPAFVILPWLLGDAARNARSTDAAAGPGSGSPDALPSDGGNVRLCLWVIVLVCGISLLANVLYALLEARYGPVYVALVEHEEFELAMDRAMMRLEMKQAALAQQIAANATSAAAAHTHTHTHTSPPLPRKPANTKNPSAKHGGAYTIVQTSHIEELDVAPISISMSISMHGRSLSSSDEPSSSSSLSAHEMANVNDNDGSAAADASGADLMMSSNPSSPLADGADGAGGGGGEGGSGGGGGNGAGAEHTGLLGGLSSLWRHTDSNNISGSGSGGSNVNANSRVSVWCQPFHTLRSLSPLFWLVFLMHCLLSPILSSFSAFGPQFFTEKYSLTQEEAGVLTGILYASIMLSPLFGWAVDRVGYRCIVQTVAAAVLPLCFVAFHFAAFSSVSPYVLVVLLGLAFAVTDANSLAMVADVSPGALLGTSYGLLGCGRSLALLFEPALVALIHHRTNHWYWSTVLFIAVSSLGWAVSFGIYVFDCNTDNLMTQSARAIHHHNNLFVDGSIDASSSSSSSGLGHGAGDMSRASTSAIGGDLELHRLYPELEIVFDEDNDAHDDDDNEQEFKLDEFEDDLDQLP